jgi:RNA polymerase sigma-70 factor (ECF subfamily)
MLSSAEALFTHVTHATRAQPIALWDARHLYEDLLRLALRMTRHPQDAEDIVQSAFLRALESSAPITSDAVRRAWLTTVVRHMSIDRARAKRRRNVTTSDTDQLPMRPSEPQPAWMAITAEQLQHALDDCKPHLREVWRLYYERGFSQAQIAAFLDISPRTVATRLHRLRGWLRETLEPVIDAASVPARTKCDK